MGKAERVALDEIEKAQEREDADRIAVKNLETKMEKERKRKETLDHFK